MKYVAIFYKRIQLVSGVGCGRWLGEQGLVVVRILGSGVRYTHIARTGLGCVNDVAVSRSLLSTTGVVPKRGICVTSGGGNRHFRACVVGNRHNSNGVYLGNTTTHGIRPSSVIVVVSCTLVSFRRTGSFGPSIVFPSPTAGGMMGWGDVFSVFVEGALSCEVWTKLFFFVCSVFLLLLYFWLFIRDHHYLATIARNRGRDNSATCGVTAYVGRQSEEYRILVCNGHSFPSWLRSFSEAESGQIQQRSSACSD